ncbi:hypothetical protein GCM10010232_20370 [Streptomyces amakusaensis]|uniref:ARG and Rhodanese-Phosphatase-superfamily-associated domain-containing protein n=1 Tax=Streptomyces amakusaensis TaxID=67271 RepID=A0ABW0ACW7_9ACTN
MNKLDLSGLSVLPSQVWGGIRLVPLVREAPVEGLRLRREVYGDQYAEVETRPGQSYVSYVPHGFVADWSVDGLADGSADRRAKGGGAESAVYGTRLGDAAPPCVPLRSHHRLAKRLRARGAAERRLRFLPQHLALEGYLSLHFGGPSTAWDEWSAEALRQGLPPRAEAAYGGWRIPGLDEALRVFEIHPGQCGVLLYAADSLAAAFVVPHPEDYRALHATLIEDLYGEVIHQYAFFGGPVPEFTVRLGDGRGVRTLDGLRAAARAAEREWAEGHDALMAARLLDPSYLFERVYAMEGFTLWRFLPSFRRGEREQHIGEVITDHRGRTAYLKTFRLSDAQIRRGYLLTVLSAHDWDLDRASATLGDSRAELVRRIRDAGFEALVREGAERMPRRGGGGGGG